MMTTAASGPRPILRPRARLERKFFVPTGLVAHATAMLWHSCIPDPQFPYGLIQSIYYDTSDLELFYQSVDGSRFRRKVRIRWYDRPKEQYATVYIEVKSKHGLAGTKARVAVQAEAARLISLSTEGPIPYDRLCQILTILGFVPERRIYPVVMIQYTRSRFVEIATGMRVSLDQQIESRLMATEGIFINPRARLSGAILELKGYSMEVPPTLFWLRQFQVDWTRYSKYAVCLGVHMAEPGLVGVSMPSGRIEPT